MHLKKSRLKREVLEQRSYIDNSLQGVIPSISHEHYRIIKGTSVGGDAPKELLKVYFFQSGKKRIHNPWLWDTYIAKTGHKWYPYESITEYILNQLGCCLGLEMADSKLVRINGQVRFLSKLFRKEKYQVLEHGAEIYSGHLRDKEFVEEVESLNMARDFFTLTFTREALRSIYSFQYEDIFLSFVRMLIFDAIIGNNDRHFYNWGVLRDIKNREQPRFSPIYDTARALFWNRDEGQLKDIYKDSHRLDTVLNKYVKGSRPKTGIERKSNANHFDLIKKLNSRDFPGTRDLVHSLITKENKKKCITLIEEDLKPLLSPERRCLIIKCLNLRFEKLLTTIK